MPERRRRRYARLLQLLCLHQNARGLLLMSHVSSTRGGQLKAVPKSRSEESLVRQLVDYFARPEALDEVSLQAMIAETRRNASERGFSDDDLDDVDDDEGHHREQHWLSKLFLSLGGGFQSAVEKQENRAAEDESKSSAAKRKRYRTAARKAAREVEKLVPLKAWKEAKVAFEVLEWWARRRGDVEAWRCVAFGARCAAYMAGTPFGKDGALVAAALLSEAYRNLDGLSLALVSDHAGNETAAMTTALANLEQLSELQRARWDAEGAARFVAAGAVENDDGLRFDDDELLYTCRLPTTHAYNLRQMLVAVATDFRALPLLLVRRLVALRDERDARREKATLTPSSLARDALDVHAPLAERFGLYALKNDLEDAAFERLAPFTRKRIKSALDASREEREIVLDDIERNLRVLLLEGGTNEFASLRVSTREKEPYSVWRKQSKLRAIRTKGDFLEASWWAKLSHLDEARASGNSDDSSAAREEDASYPRVLYPLDTIALRIVLEPRRENHHPENLAHAGEALCYRALRMIHSTWRPLPNRTKDYVATPKSNGYQSLHTTVNMRFHGRLYPFEVQIRTRDMHNVAEFGSAAHVLYSRSQRDPPELTLDAAQLASVAAAGVAAAAAARTEEEPPSAAAKAAMAEAKRKEDPAARAPPRRRRRRKRTFVLDYAGVPFRSTVARSTRTHRRNKPAPPSEQSRRARAILDEIRGSGGVVVEREAAPTVVVQKRRRESRRRRRRDNRVSIAQLEAALAAGDTGDAFFPNLFRVRGEFVDYDDAAAQGLQFGASLGERLRRESVFVLASGGRVLTVNPRNSAVDALTALQRDLEADACRGGPGNRVVIRRPVGPLEINGRRHTYISSLSHKLVTGDEVIWNFEPDDDAADDDAAAEGSFSVVSS